MREAVVEHLVRFTTSEGREGQHTAEALDDALRFVERLRNAEDIREVRVFRMQEVPIEFRTYYKVEVRPPDGGETVADTAAVTTAEGGQDGKPALVGTVAGEGEGGEANGRRLFGRP
jgi:hypothetical protein